MCVCIYVRVWTALVVFGDARWQMKASIAPSPFPVPVHLYLKSWFLLLEGVGTLSEVGQPSWTPAEELAAVAATKTNKQVNKSTPPGYTLPCISGVTANVQWTGSDPLGGHLSYHKGPHSCITPFTWSNLTPHYTSTKTPFPHPYSLEGSNFPKSLFCTVHLYYLFHFAYLPN